MLLIKCFLFNIIIIIFIVLYFIFIYSLCSSTLKYLLLLSQPASECAPRQPASQRMCSPASQPASESVPQPARQRMCSSASHPQKRVSPQPCRESRSPARQRESQCPASQSESLLPCQPFIESFKLFLFPSSMVTQGVKCLGSWTLITLVQFA